MNHRDTEFTERRTARSWVALCSLCLCGSISGFASDKSPAIYNDGVRAYQTNDLAVAARTFEQATAATDRLLQQRAFYNLGNTAYRLGEVDPAKAEQLWQRAIKSYESALALDPKDGDAKFNREFVKQKLEELKKQQQEQQQNQQKQDKDKQEHNQQQSQQGQKQEEDSRKDAKTQSEEQKEQEQQAQGEPKPNENFDKQRAAALLDNLREDERNWNFFPEVQMKDLKESGQPVKDW